MSKLKIINHYELDRLIHNETPFKYSIIKNNPVLDSNMVTLKIKPFNYKIELRDREFYKIKEKLDKACELENNFRLDMAKMMLACITLWSLSYIVYYLFTH